MRRFRFTIANLLGVVLFVAVGTAALRSSSDAWDSALFGVTLLILLASLLLVAYRRERSRAYWLGFALFGWIYLGASLIPPVASRLPTTHALTWLDSKRPLANAPQGIAFTDFDRDGSLDLLVASATPNQYYVNRGGGTFQVATTNPQGGPPATTLQSGWTRLWYAAAAGGGTSEGFLGIGHALFAWALAFLGAHLARFLHDRERSRPTPPTGDPA